MKDLVVFLPGITGSTLKRDGKTVWGLSAGAVVNALMRGALDDLVIPVESGEDDLGDGVTVDGVVDDVHLIPGFWKIDGYGGFVDALAQRVAIRPGFNFRTFPYDWRRDNRVSARRLQQIATAELIKWRKTTGDPEAKLILIAHSMGGLVARYFMEVLGGWRDTRQLITLGTPFRGSLNAVGFLVNGFARQIGPFKADATRALRSFASVHQLLPTYACVDNGGGGLVHVADGGLHNVDPAKAADAARFHQEIEDAVLANGADPAYRPSRISPVLSSMQPTFQSVRVSEGKAELLGERDGRNDGGDGTVPTVSALAKGMAPHQGFYVEGIHGSLQAKQPVAELVAGLLRGADLDLDRLRAGAAPGVVRFALEDAYSAGPVPLRAELAGAVEQRLAVTATEAETGRTVETTLWPRDGAFEGELALMAGAWRVTVGGERSEPVTDLTLVIATEEI